jgi:hypothetical protein
MLLNAVQNAAKCETKSIKITLQWYKYNIFKPLKAGLNRAKHPLKVVFLWLKVRNWA